MNELLAVLIATSIVFSGIYIIAKIFKLNPSIKNDYWTGFFAGSILGCDDPDH